MPSFQVVGERGYKPGLERVEGFCREIGAPHLSYPTIHVAGTNGKGSTSHMLTSVLMSAGYRVGLFTSPHLLDFRERIRLSGEMITEQEVVDFVAQHREAMERWSLSFFEMTAALAFDFFARQGAQVAVIECGLGGRLDATNIVRPLLSVITNIGIDHTKYLGTSLTEIAREKCGIIKPSTPLVIGQRGEELARVASEVAAERGSELTFAEDSYTYINREPTAAGQCITLRSAAGEQRYDLDLAALYQHHNLITARTAIDILNKEGVITIPQEAMHQGFAGAAAATHLMGRWQWLSKSPRVVCDTGHNAHGIEQVVRQIALERYDRLYCVLGLANDKDVEHILRLFPADTHFIFTRAKVERAFSTDHLAGVAARLGIACECVERVAEALEYAKKLTTDSDLIYIGGSNFVVAEIF